MRLLNFYLYICSIINSYQNQYHLNEDEINADRFVVKHVTLVDAHTGIIVARGMGDPENICAGANPGVYILVTEYGAMREAKKIIIR